MSTERLQPYNKDGSKKDFEELVKGKRIAVVGNALSLFDRSYGEEIDSHDIVIRFNKAAPLYYANDVSITHGSKTHIWAFWTVGAFIKTTLNEANSENISNIFYNSPDILKIQMTKSNHYVYTKKYIKYTYSTLRFDLLKKNVKRYEKYLGTNNTKPKNRFDRRPVNTENKKMQCSAGLIMLNWLLESNPKEVNIYGMDFKRTPTFSEVENFNRDMRNRIDQRCNHNFELEEIYAKEIILKKTNFTLKE